MTATIAKERRSGADCRADAPRLEFPNDDDLVLKRLGGRLLYLATLLKSGPVSRSVMAKLPPHA
jgi:hypothetical protein